MHLCQVPWDLGNGAPRQVGFHSLEAAQKWNVPQAQAGRPAISNSIINNYVQSQTTDFIIIKWSSNFSPPLSGNSYNLSAQKKEAFFFFFLLSLLGKRISRPPHKTAFKLLVTQNKGKPLICNSPATWTDCLFSFKHPCTEAQRSFFLLLKLYKPELFLAVNTQFHFSSEGSQHKRDRTGGFL